MNLPDKITISGMEYEIIKSEKPIILNDQQVGGMIDYRNKTIEIDIINQCPQEQEETLLHEILHGIVHDREIDFDNDDEELIIEQLARGLYQVLKENKLFQ